MSMVCACVFAWRRRVNETNYNTCVSLLVLRGECGNEPGDSLKGNHRDGLWGHSLIPC